MSKFSDILKVYNDMTKKHGAGTEDSIDMQKLANMVFISATAIRRILAELAEQESEDVH